MSLTKIHVLGQQAEHDKAIDPFGHGLPGNQFPAMTTSDTLIWRDAGLRGDMLILVEQLLPCMNRKSDELIIGVGETQQVRMHHFSDTSPASSNPSGFIHDLPV